MSCESAGSDVRIVLSYLWIYQSVTPGEILLSSRRFAVK